MKIGPAKAVNLCYECRGDKAPAFLRPDSTGVASVAIIRDIG